MTPLTPPALALHYLPSLLDQEFRGEVRYLVRTSPTGRPTRSWLSPLQVRYMLWSRASGMPVASIASAVRCTERAVYARLAAAREDPAEMLRCGYVQLVYMEHLRGGERWYCRDCGLLSREAQLAARHAWRHVFGRLRNR